MREQSRNRLLFFYFNTKRRNAKLKLVISEKPSVAQSIAAVIEGGGYLVSWCLGHLAELAEADTYDKKCAKWRREDLSILPESWRFTVGKDKWKQFDILRILNTS
jgi:DNA topoisomerase-3